MLLKPVLPVFQYIINYDYISKVLCINKENKELKCSGTCHLKNELAKSSENSTPASKDKETKTNAPFEILFLNKINPIHFEGNGILFIIQLNSFYFNLYSYLDECSIFHPPSFTV